MAPDFRTILARYHAAVEPLAEPEPLGNAGGLSGARLWRFPSRRGWLVARAWPPDGPGRERLQWIHDRLAAARGLGFVPVPERDRSGATIQEHGGRLWDVSPWMPGTADRDRPPAAVRVRAAFAGLARFHQAMHRSSWAFDPSPGLAERLAEVEALQRRGFAEFQRSLDRAADGPSRAAARRWLDLARGLAGRVEAMLRPWAGRYLALPACLRDARPEHFLFEGGELSGLVDFGAMDNEAVSADLARLLAGWIGPDRPLRALALGAYEAIRPLAPEELELVPVFERSAALLGGGRWVRWHFVEGRTFDDPSAVAAGLGRGLERLTELAVELG